MSGWFAVKHGITQHHIFKGRPERIAIWIWLVDNAAWADTEHDINGTTSTIHRGAVSASLRRIASETGTSLQVVRGFLDRLRGENMINTAATHGRTTITLCNYEKYQSTTKSGNTGVNTAATQQQHIKEQYNNIPVGTADKSASNSVDEISSITSALWSIGKAYLSEHGVRNGGALIGKWRSKAGSDTKVLGAIEAAQKSGTQDPIPYITKVLADEGSNKPKTWSERQMAYEALSTDEYINLHLGL